jgi:flagellar biosynthesis chaperone FliJ
MAKFRFRLQPVLDDRLAKERDQQMIVAKWQARKSEVEQRVQSLQQRLIGDRMDLRGRLGAAESSQQAASGGLGGQIVDLALVRQGASSALFGLVELRRLAIELAGVMRNIELARVELAKRAMARKAVEMLRDKAKEQWLSEQKRLEAITLDEISSIRAARRLMAEQEDTVEIES